MFLKIKRKPFLVKAILALFLVPITILLVCKGFNDKWSIQSSLISSIQRRQKIDSLAAYVIEDYAYSNYYNANAFYRIQQLSSFWNYEDELCNTAFFRYNRFEDTDIFTLKKSDIGTTVSSPLIVPLAKNPINRFHFKLLEGTSKDIKDKTCFNYVYLSESVAKQLLGFKVQDIISNDEYKKLLDSEEIICILKSINSSTNINTTEKPTRIAGIIDTSSLGIMEEYCGNEFVCAAWTEDLQLTIRCPELILLFTKDRVKNEVYLRELEFLNSESSKWHYFFSDQNGFFIKGKIDSEIRSLDTGNNAFLVILGLLSMIGFIFLIFLLRKEKRRLRICVFFGIVILFVLSVLSVNYIFVPFVDIFLNLSFINSYVVLLIPLTSIVLFFDKRVVMVDYNSAEVTL